MFSKEYFNYLIKSKKYLLIFIVLAAILMAMGNSKEFSIIGQGFICVLLTYIIPCNVFYHVHDKKAVDTFFSIPVSRKALLVTGILFSILCVYVPFLIGFSVYAIKASMGITLFISALLKMLLVAFVLVMFNSTLFLIGNNVVDGSIMIAAYTFMPVAFLLALDSFTNSFVAGQTLEQSFVSYLSPILISTDLFFDLFKMSLVNIHNIIALLIYFVLAGFLLYKFYVNRSVERASSTSDKPYSYPLVIYLYVVLMLFIISSQYNFYYDGIASFINDFFLVYLMLFIVFVGAHFVYKRKFYLSYKLPLLYILALLATISFAFIARNTKGFGLANNYNREDTRGYYILDTWYEYGSYDSQIVEAIKQLENSDKVEYLSTTVIIGDYNHRKEVSKDSLQIINKYREKGIEYFYKENKNYDRDLYTNLSITAGDNRYYSYHFEDKISYKDLLALAKDSTCNIMIVTSYGEYRLLADGSLNVTTVYSY